MPDTGGTPPIQIYWQYSLIDVAPTPLTWSCRDRHIFLHVVYITIMWKCDILRIPALLVYPRNSLTKTAIQTMCYCIILEYTSISTIDMYRQSITNQKSWWPNITAEIEVELMNILNVQSNEHKRKIGRLIIL